MDSKIIVLFTEELNKYKELIDCLKSFSCIVCIVDEDFGIYLDDISFSIDSFIVDSQIADSKEIINKILKNNRNQHISILSDKSACIDISCNDCLKSYNIVKLLSPVNSEEVIKTLFKQSKCKAYKENDLLFKLMKIKKEFRYSSFCTFDENEFKIILPETNNYYETTIVKLVDKIEEFDLKYDISENRIISIYN